MDNGRKKRGLDAFDEYISKDSKKKESLKEEDSVNEMAAQALSDGDSSDDSDATFEPNIKEDFNTDDEVKSSLEVVSDEDEFSGEENYAIDDDDDDDGISIGMDNESSEGNVSEEGGDELQESEQKEEEVLQEGNDEEVSQETEENEDEGGIQTENFYSSFAQRSQDLGDDSDEENESYDDYVGMIESHRESENYLDPDAEYLDKYSDDEAESLDNFNTVDRKKEEESSKDDEELENVERGNPNEVLEKKKAPTKLQKTRLLAILGGITVLFLVFFNARIIEGKGNKDKKKDIENVNVEDYKPDWGDYESRKYQVTEKDKENDDMKFIQDMIGADDKKPYEPPVQKSSGQPPAVSPAQDEAMERWRNARDSVIKSGGEGFGRKNVEKKSVVSNLVDGMGSYMGNDSYASGMNPMMTKDQYANDYLNRLGSMAGLGGNGNGISDYDRVNNGRWSTDGAYDRNAVGGQVASIPEYSLYPGTILPAVLVSGINTDYPGNITARIISPVYDSRTGKNLLIPQGSILRGSYSSSSIGLAKVQIAWQTLIINRDGRDFVVNLGSMVGIDARGYSGIKGSLNDHFFQYLKAAGLSSLFTTINSNIYAYSNAQKNATIRQMIADSQEIGNKLADKMLDRALNIQPTVVVKPGTRVNVDVDQILTLIPQNLDEPVQRYIRK